MNTTKKGDAFEDRIYSILCDLLANGDFFVGGKASKIFQKKGYYSRERDSSIITDISIETYMPGADEYSLLTIIECKNLNHNVPVDDIEEFDSKLRQLGEHNTKGVVFTKLGFQKGAFNIGKSKRLGLCVVDDKDKLNWINYRKENSKVNISPSILSRIVGEAKIESNFCAYNCNKTFDNIPDLLIDLGVIDYYKHKAKYVEVEYLSEAEISTCVSKLTNESYYSNNGLDLDELCKRLERSHSISFELDAHLNDSILGKVNYSENKIQIDKGLKEDNAKWRFTLAHEIGHFILHKRYSLQLSEMYDKEMEVYELCDLSQNIRMEIQANIFASQLLLPTKPLKLLIKQYFIEERIYKGYLYLDHQGINQYTVMKFLKQVQEYFQVSISAAKYRLIGLGFLKDATDTSLKNIMRRSLNG
jgi:Zn-dependent peptidase ImmA (M78 family)